MALKLFSRKKKTKEVETGELDQSYWAYVKRQYRKNKRALFSIYVIGFLAIIALFADFIANEKPIVASYNGSVHFPVLRGYAVDLGLANWPKDFQNTDWKELEYGFAIWPPIPYLPQNLELSADANFAPPSAKHWLGTDQLGRDVAAGMVHGTRIAFLVGIISMGIAMIIGIFFGAIAGFYGDNELQMRRGRVLFNFVFIVLAFFYGFYLRSGAIAAGFSGGLISMLFHLIISFIIFFGILIALNLLFTPIIRLPWLKEKVFIPVDILITRLIEVVVSVPVLILILAVVTIVKPSILTVMMVIGAVSWTGIARFTRAELLRVRQLEYIAAANAMGFNRFRTMFLHAVPNALSPVFITIAFGIAGAILTESTLSFLGVGVPTETITWGKLLALARSNPNAWWLAIFPGFAIFITVTMFNLIGEGLTDALDPRLKQ